MKKLIIMTGDLATGKTTFSKILSERYNIEAYNKDTIKEVLGDTIGFTNREENLKLSHGTIGVMTHIFEKYAATGHDLILEANFHRDEIGKLKEIANMYGVEVLTLVFEAELHTLYERFVHRIEFENRHPVHKSAGLVDFEAFEEYILNSRKEVNIEDYVTIEATDFTYQTDAGILAMIDDFMR